MTGQPSEADILFAAQHIEHEAQKARAAADQPGWARGMRQKIRDRANGYEKVAAWMRAQVPLPAPPTANDDEAFLAAILAAANAGEAVTAEDVARLRRLAGWADTAPPIGWNGTLDRGEVARAVEDALKRMREAGDE